MVPRDNPPLAFLTGYPTNVVGDFLMALCRSEHRYYLVGNVSQSGGVLFGQMVEMRTFRPLILMDTDEFICRLHWCFPGAGYASPAGCT